MCSDFVNFAVYFFDNKYYIFMSFISLYTTSHFRILWSRFKLSLDGPFTPECSVLKTVYISISCHFSSVQGIPFRIKDELIST